MVAELVWGGASDINSSGPSIEEAVSEDSIKGMMPSEVRDACRAPAAVESPGDGKSRTCS